MNVGRETSRLPGDRLLALLLTAPAIISIAIVTLYPVGYSFWLSLHRRDLLKPYLGQPFVGLQNYLDTLTDSIFWDSMCVTVYFVGMAVVLEIGLGLLIAMMLNREFPGRVYVRVLALLPWAVPSVVNGTMWKWIFNPAYGALNGLLFQLGLIKQYVAWLGEPFLALNMVVLADVWTETPFIMLLILAALQTIPKDLYEAAIVDGASRWQLFTRVTLPLSSARTLCCVPAARAAASLAPLPMQRMQQACSTAGSIPLLLTPSCSGAQPTRRNCRSRALSRSSRAGTIY